MNVDVEEHRDADSERRLQVRRLLAAPALQGALAEVITFASGRTFGFLELTCHLRKDLASGTTSPLLFEELPC